MGYYVNYEGRIEFKTSDESTIVAGLKALNFKHEMKGGGRYPKGGEDPFEDAWFAWMPKRYHEYDDLTTVDSILALLGFKVVQRDDLNGRSFLTVTYDNKTGDEDVFLNELARWAEIELEGEGEDGSRWLYETACNTLFVREQVVAYGERHPVAEGLRRTATVRQGLGAGAVHTLYEVG